MIVPYAQNSRRIYAGAPMTEIAVIVIIVVKRECPLGQTLLILAGANQ